jgi:hypothetical protein
MVATGLAPQLAQRHMRSHLAHACIAHRRPAAVHASGFQVPAHRLDDTVHHQVDLGLGGLVLGLLGHGRHRVRGDRHAQGAVVAAGLGGIVRFLTAIFIINIPFCVRAQSAAAGKRDVVAGEIWRCASRPADAAGLPPRVEVFI